MTEYSDFVKSLYFQFSAQKPDRSLWQSYSLGVKEILSEIHWILDEDLPQKSRESSLIEAAYWLYRIADLLQNEQRSKLTIVKGDLEDYSCNDSSNKCC